MVVSRWRKKTLSIENLRENPDRVPLETKVEGFIVSTAPLTFDWPATPGLNVATSNPPASRTRLAGARIYVDENPAYEDYTDAEGRFEIKMPTGTFKFGVIKSGYFSLITISTNIVKGTNRRNVQLTQKLTGIVTGYIVFNDHLVISQIVASSTSPSGFYQEYVELYNPTTAQILFSTSSYKLKYVNREQFGSNIVRNIPLVINNPVIQPYGFYLIANTQPVVIAGMTVTPDAVYDYSVS